MNAVFILCLIMSIIFLSIPFFMLIVAAVKRQSAILKAGLIWFAANMLLVLLLWILYAVKLRFL